MRINELKCTLSKAPHPYGGIELLGVWSFIPCLLLTSDIYKYVCATTVLTHNK